MRATENPRRGGTAFVAIVLVLGLVSCVGCKKAPPPEPLIVEIKIAARQFLGFSDETARLFSDDVARYGDEALRVVEGSGDEITTASTGLIVRFRDQILARVALDRLDIEERLARALCGAVVARLDNGTVPTAVDIGVATWREFGNGAETLSISQAFGAALHQELSAANLQPDAVVRFYIMKWQVCRSG